jgi:hypothetical protein
MSIYARAAMSSSGSTKDLSSIPAELELFAHIEGLCGEEAALLAVPLEQRRQEQRERLRTISKELDRIRETLREWADRLRADGGSRTSGP